MKRGLNMQAKKNNTLSQQDCIATPQKASFVGYYLKQ